MFLALNQTDVNQPEGLQLLKTSLDGHEIYIVTRPISEATPDSKMVMSVSPSPYRFEKKHCQEE